MLTRLRVKGFKNLYDVDIAFGPFTCIAGVNGVGKSNLFDAITFLSDLTQYSFVEAAARVRDPIARSGDIRALFHRSKNGYADEMSFEAEFVVPSNVVDDFGRSSAPSITFLRYVVAFRFREGDGARNPDRLELANEELSHINIGEAWEHLAFEHSKTRFRDSVVKGRRHGGPFISSTVEDGQTIIELHGDRKAGRVSRILAESSPRTIVGATNTDSHPTVLAARREMQSWRLLQLEPSALRQPDEFTADPHVAPNGAHLPATLRRLGEDAYGRIANQLAELLPDVQRVRADVDEARRLITLYVEGRDGVSYPARSLSDGTLRFLALAVIGADPEAAGLICFEEPENGIHPLRMPAMVSLLQSLAVRTDEEVSPDNPLRQVIVNTHSPLIVKEVPAESLVVAVPYRLPERLGGSQIVRFQCLPNTWRCAASSIIETVSMGELMAYLEGLTGDRRRPDTPTRRHRRPRVIDAVEEYQQRLEFADPPLALV